MLELDTQLPDIGHTGRWVEFVFLLRCLSMAKKTHLIIVVETALLALVVLQNRLRNLVRFDFVLAVLDRLPQGFDFVLPDLGAVPWPGLRARRRSAYPTERLALSSTLGALGALLPAFRVLSSRSTSLQRYVV